VSDNSGKQRRLLVERALTAAKQGDWEAALAANRELLALTPSIEVHNRIGKALSELGRFQEAYQAYQRAAEFDSHNTIAQRNLRRLEQLKDLADEPGAGHPLARSSFFIEETGKTALASLVRPAEHVVWRRIMPGDPLELRIDAATGIVNVHSLEGAYVGQIEPRIGERIIELTHSGNRYAAAVIDHEADTLRVILREIYQDPSLSDRLSFPTRVRSTAPRAYIRKDILFDDSDLLGDDEESDEPLAEEAEEEPEMEDEEFTDDDLDDSGI
jgi:tetratricopeptide (TPR) repeat protein